MVIPLPLFLFMTLIGYPPLVGGRDEPVLSERDRKELMSLVNENISMDFILEMKEAFQLFDKVCNCMM